MKIHLLKIKAMSYLSFVWLYSPGEEQLEVALAGENSTTEPPVATVEIGLRGRPGREYTSEVILTYANYPDHQVYFWTINTAGFPGPGGGYEGPVMIEIVKVNSVVGKTVREPWPATSWEGWMDHS